jgi:cold shock CspA family protein
MEFRYGLTNNERTTFTVFSWDAETRTGYGRSDAFKGQIHVREQDILYPIGSYYIPTDDIGKDVKVGDMFECMVVEVRQGLIGLGCRYIGCTRNDPLPSEPDGSWERPSIPRLMGVVVHYNDKKAYGFIKSDQLRKEAFFQKREILVPFDKVQDPSEAIVYNIGEGSMVTFDCVEAMRGPRALAVKNWKGE